MKSALSALHVQVCSMSSSSNEQLGGTLDSLISVIVRNAWLVSQTYHCGWVGAMSTPTTWVEEAFIVSPSVNQVWSNAGRHRTCAPGKSSATSTHHMPLKQSASTSTQQPTDGVESSGV
jgi:hypothetical protein